MLPPRPNHLPPAISSVQVSQYTPLSALRLVELATQAGIPPGTLNLLTGAHLCLAGVRAYPIGAGTDSCREC